MAVVDSIKNFGISLLVKNINGVGDLENVETRFQVIICICGKVKLYYSSFKTTNDWNHKNIPCQIFFQTKVYNNQPKVCWGLLFT